MSRAPIVPRVSGWMLALRWNTLPGSYRALIWASRSYFCVRDDERRRLGTEFSWSGVARTDKLTWLSRALRLTGFAIAAYLTTVYLQDIPPACFGGSTGCVTAQRSSYAHVAGIPLPLFGTCRLRAVVRTAGMVFTVVAVGASALLTYVELNVIHAILVRRVGGLGELPCDRQFGPVRSRRAVNRLASLQTRSHADRPVATP
jgi:hypothetical protein